MKIIKMKVNLHQIYDTDDQVGVFLTLIATFQSSSDLSGC